MIKIRGLTRTQYLSIPHLSGVQLRCDVLHYCPTMVGNRDDRIPQFLPTSCPTSWDCNHVPIANNFIFAFGQKKLSDVHSIRARVRIGWAPFPRNSFPHRHIPRNSSRAILSRAAPFRAIRVSRLATKQQTLKRRRHVRKFLACCWTSRRRWKLSTSRSWPDVVLVATTGSTPSC